MALSSRLNCLLPLLACLAGCASVQQAEWASSAEPSSFRMPPSASHGWTSSFSAAFARSAASAASSAAAAAGASAATDASAASAAAAAEGPVPNAGRSNVDGALGASGGGAGGGRDGILPSARGALPKLFGTASPAARIEPQRLEPLAGTVPGPIARSGSAAYHVPRSMKLNEASRVELWIDLSLPAAQLQAALAEKLKVDAAKIGVRVKRGSAGDQAEGVAGLGQVWVGQHMTALLRGDGFRIEPQGARGKSLAAERQARWDWTVTPLRDPGDGKLMLTLEASIDRGVDQDAFPSIVEYVEVQLLPWWQRIPELLAQVNALLALFGVGLGAVVLFVVKWLRKRWDGEVPLPRLRA